MRTGKSPCGTTTSLLAMNVKHDLNPQDWPRTKRPAGRRNLPWAPSRLYGFIVGMCQIGPWITLSFMTTLALADSSNQFNLYRHLGMLFPPWLWASEHVRVVSAGDHAP
jgi:hypothetical protein